MKKLTIEDIQVKGKRVLMRVDFNVPLKGDRVANDKRIRASLPSIRYVLDHGGRLILMSHLGRPRGRRVPELSLKPCVTALQELLGTPVAFAGDCIGEAVQEAVSGLTEGQALLLENLRFHEQEENNDLNFAGQLAASRDLYVNDAFGSAHRAHASTEGVTHYISQCAAGFLMTRELDYLGRLMENPAKPFVAILGGAKVSDKIEVINNLLPRVDKIVIGGGMAFTFFKAEGFEIGNSLLEADKVDLAKNLLSKGGDKIVLPSDCVVSDEFDLKGRKTGEIQEVNVRDIRAGWIGLDIGTGSIARFQSILKNAKTVFWNGPMGVFELEQTANGTFAVARMLAEITGEGAVTVIGGGDSAAAVDKAGVENQVSHVSTGGGASLEFMEGKTLPGVAALTDKV